MHLIIGLGNPGRKYQETRHNIGFQVVDEFLKENNFPRFKFAKKFNAEISEGILGGEKILLAKPQTFMNLSGKSAKPLIDFYKITPPGRVVIHDDIDILLGEIRIAKNRGAAGHKGIESIIKELKNKNFIRFRIGICPKTGKPKNPENFVLQKFNKEEKEIIKEVIKKTAKAIEYFLKEGLEKAMNKFNK
ncbi:MAG: aminoacyl-tRNA hydrolase [Candidatus Nealsonbacteria bacterium CG18_big_fil_WC_8_21_14_2_50_37_10]|uniref:Peptidyl-tRNA hydrolase n=1 Tax=Candidatus Nealsonbacteria bacterium CG18_big_fil_WC_8_21_14_2_50_37_10 TaxID=1974717 RepID=A0A2H0FHM2_9BACT|nr:MAG: aminoacyl-tRNA hydrolase [Candidatus Nealsonbacteria bacterium CG18_big_fil_WC_8_21_14_2_50_37_10]